jgi:hypothetical protein
LTTDRAASAPAPPPPRPFPPSGITLTSLQQLGVLVAVLAGSGLLNLGSARVTAFMTTLGAMWHIIPVAAFCLTLGLVAKNWQSAQVGWLVVCCGMAGHACIRI